MSGEIQSEGATQEPNGFSLEPIVMLTPTDVPVAAPEVAATITASELAARYSRTEAPSMPPNSAIDPNSQDPAVQGLRRWMAEAPWKHEPRPSDQ
jgi:hypothetical protein